MSSPVARTKLTVTPLEVRATPAAALDRVQPANVVFLAGGGVAQEVAAFSPDFDGGAWVAAGDVNGDGTPDLIAAPGAGTRPTVKIFDGASRVLIREFDSYESAFTGGVFVAAADLTGDGKAEVVTGTDQGGGPRVRAFDLSAGGERVIADFFAIADTNFRGGVRIALGDVTGDGTADLVASAGFLGGPRIAGFDGKALAGGRAENIFPDFFGFEETLRNGAYVAAGDVTGDGKAELILGAGPGGGPRVKVLDGRAITAGRQEVVGNFFAGSPDGRGGVRVGAAAKPDGTAHVLSAENALGAHALLSDARTGKAVRALPSSVAVGAGLLSDATGRDISITVRSVPDPSVDLINAVLRGTYTGTITREVGGFPISFDNPRGVRTIEHKITVVVEDAVPRGGQTLDQARRGGVQVALFGTITLTLVGVDGFTKPLENGSSVTFDQFPEPSAPQRGSAFLDGSNGPNPPPDALNQFVTLGVLGNELRWTPAGFSGSHFSYQFNYGRDKFGSQMGYSPRTTSEPFTLAKTA